MSFYRRIKTRFINITPTGVAAEKNLFSKPANDDVSEVIRSITNKNLEKARQKTQNRAWIPYLTGALMASIKVYPAKRVGDGSITGSIGSDLIYARRQEYEHRTKAFYILRALQSVQQDMVDDLNNGSVFEDIVLSRKKKQSGSLRVELNG